MSTEHMHQSHVPTDCPGCGAPAGYPPAGPCAVHQSHHIPKADCASDAPVGTPGFRHGCWTIVVEGGGTFALNAGLVLERLAAERGPGPTRDVLERLYAAVEAAMPE